MKKKDPYNVRLDKEEKMWEKVILSGKFKPVDLNRAKKELSRAARETRLRTKQISIRVNAADLERARARALREGLPYQTVINSLIHKYAREDSR